LAQYDLAHIGALAEALTAQGIATWTVEYRRVGNPGGGWPGTFDDVARAADHLRVLAAEHPLDLERVIAVGHSAGGQLALWLAARGRLAEGAPLYTRDPLRLAGVLGLAAAADLAYLHEREVCGHVIDSLMGGSPEAFPERYRSGSPLGSVPLGVPQRLVSGARDPFWSSVARRYFEAADAADDRVQWLEAPDSGHFEMIDPSTTTWPIVRDAARRLLGLEPATLRDP
jgi:acetyl esterase/lipase